MAFLDGWSYRKSITLSRASGAVSNYQMKLLVGESSGATGEDVDCGGKCLSNFNDLRFTTPYGDAILDYWIESISGTTPNQLATVWVEFDSIGTSDTTFYMYYGNVSASSYSNGENTFPFFDNFEGSSLNTDKWELVADPTISISGSKLYLIANAPDHYIKTKTFTATALESAIRTKIQANDPGSTNNIPGFGFGNYYGGSTNTKCVAQITYSSANSTYCLYCNNETGEDYTTEIEEDWGSHTKDILWGHNDLVQFYKDDIQIGGNVTTYIPSTNLPISIGCYYLNTGSINVEVDWIFSRHYLSTEPTFGTWGTEESNDVTYSLTCSSGSIELFGTDVSLDTNLNIGSGNIVLSGNDISFDIEYDYRMSVNSGNINLFGRNVNLLTNLPFVYRTTWFINGSRFNGRIITVGPVGRHYTEYYDAFDNATDGSLILIDPGTYTYPSTDKYLQKILYVRGIGTNPSDVILQNSSSRTYHISTDSNVVFENLTLYAVDSYIGAVHFDGGLTSNITCTLNKCILSGSGDYYSMCANGANPVLLNSCIITNCILTKGYSHFCAISDLSKISLTRSELDEPLSLYLCGGSIIGIDIKSTPTEGYGSSYGEYIISDWLKGDYYRKEYDVSSSENWYINGELHTGEILRVGSTESFPNLRSAMLSASDGALILVNEGMYTDSDTTYITKTLYIRGMGDSPEDVIITSPGWLLFRSTANVQYENVTFQSDSYHICIPFWTDGAPVVSLNKCYINAQGVGYAIGGQTSGSTGTCNMTYCKVTQGYRHFIWMNVSNVSMEKVEFDTTPTYYQCTGSLSGDYVTTPTSGYGYDNGELTITKEGPGILTNYQMKLSIGKTSEVVGANIHCENRCNDDFSDIRFTNSGGVSLLPYWIEKVTGSGDNLLADIWVKHDYIGTSATKFYMYYGNNNLTEYSNGTNTFVLFDDFERGNSGDGLNGSGGWSASDTVTITDQDNYEYGGTRSVLLSGSESEQPTMSITLSSSDNYAITSYINKTNTCRIVTISHSDGTSRIAVVYESDESIKYYSGDTWVDTTYDCDVDEWVKQEIRNIDFTSKTYDIVINDTVITSAAVMNDSNEDTDVITLSGGEYNVENAFIDTLYVRKFYSPEPSFISVGDEEDIRRSITTWTTPDTITLPLIYTGTYDFIVDWGDTTSDIITAYNQPEVTHTYSVSGSYIVTITGLVSGWGFHGYNDAYKIVDVTQWGCLSLFSFDDCINLTNITATDLPNVPTNLWGVFRGCTSLLSINRLNDWDVSNVTNIAEMFYGATLFNQDISLWDVSNVTEMTRMFYGATNFNQPLNSWNVSNVTSIAAMFYGATNFNQPLNSWNVSNVTSIAAMFYGATNFNQPLNDWDVSNVTSMSDTFCNATSFNQDLSSWNTSSCTNMSCMFYGATNFNQPLNSWNVSNVTSIAEMFYGATNFNQPLNDWDVSNVTYMTGMFVSTQFDQPLNNWDVSNVMHMNIMFGNCPFNQDISSWDVSNVINMMGMFHDATLFNRDISKWDVSNVTRMTNMFNGATSFSSDNYSKLLASWSTQDVPSGTSFHAPPTYYNFMSLGGRDYLVNIKNWTISGDLGYDTIPDMVTYDTSSVTTSSFTASGAIVSGAPYISEPVNITGISLSNASTSGRVYELEYYVDDIPESPFIFEVTTKTGSGAPYDFTIPLTSAGVYDFIVDWGDTTISAITAYNQSEVTHTYSTSGSYDVSITGTMEGWTTRLTDHSDSMYLSNIKQWGCFEFNNHFSIVVSSGMIEETLTGLQFSYYGSNYEEEPLNITATDVPDLRNVSELSSCFSNRPNIYVPNIHLWNTSSINSLKAFSFYTVNSLSSISNWDVSNVTDMKMTFYLSTFDYPLNNWDTSNVTDMSYMFTTAIYFNQPLDKWNVSNVTNMSYMFYNVHNFNQPLNSWNVSNVTNMSYMFTMAIYFNQPLDKWNVSNVTNMSYMFYNVNSFDQDLSSWVITACTDMTEMFTLVTLSTTNYSNMLISWASQNVQPNVVFSGGYSKYNESAVSARSHLINVHGWTITDGGLE